MISYVYYNIDFMFFQQFEAGGGFWFGKGKVHRERGDMGSTAVDVIQIHNVSA